MPIHSSFLIRCWLDLREPATPMRRYQVEHVQSGKQVHFLELAEVMRWIATVNEQAEEVGL